MLQLMSLNYDTSANCRGMHIASTEPRFFELMDPEILELSIYPEKTIIKKTHAPQFSLQHYLQ